MALTAAASQQFESATGQFEVSLAGHFAVFALLNHFRRPFDLLHSS
jgi:hypothetical protein